VDTIIEGIIAAVISYAVPWALKRVLPDRAPGSAFPWLAWVLALAFGGGLGGIISGLIGLSFEGFGNWGIFGMCLGIMGWIVTQRMGIGPWFAAASALGWMVTPVFQSMGLGNAAWAIAGLLVGLLQWPALQGKVRGAFWWVPASMVAWLAGGLLGLGVGMAIVGSDFVIAWVLGWTVVGGVGGLVLAPVLGWLWNRPTLAAAAGPQG